MNTLNLYNGSGLRAQGELAHSQKLLSVIIPAYNVEKFLNKCVESVVNQTYKNIEIIIVDDGSKDSTPQICDELANKYNNIKIIHQENQGSNIARLNGFNASCGEYIAFIDSDDYIDLNAYETAINVLEDNNCDMVMFGVYTVHPDGKIIGEYKNEPRVFDNKHDIYLYFFTLAGSLCDKVYKRVLFENVTWPKIIHFEDAFVSIQVFAKAEKLIVINKSFYYYVQNPASSTHSPNRGKMKSDAFQAADFIVNFTAKTFPEFLPEAFWRKLLIYERIFMDYAASHEPNRNEILNNLMHEIRKHYAILKSELKAQHSNISSRSKNIFQVKYRAKNFVFVHLPKLAVLYSKIRLKIRDLFKI